MWFPEGHRSGFFLGSALLAIGVFGGGCLTAGKPLFTATGPGWHTQQGQALWRPERKYPELGGDLVLAAHQDGRCLVEFAKTPMALVSVQTTPTRWRIEFPPRRIGLSGHGQPPTRFAWLYLDTALAGKPLPPTFRFERKPDGGWRLENPRSGESIEGFLAP